MSSSSEWLVCGLCGAKVRQLFDNPAHRKLLARLLVQEVENIPSRYIINLIESVNNLAIISGSVWFVLSRPRLLMSSKSLLARASR